MKKIAFVILSLTILSTSCGRDSSEKLIIFEKTEDYKEIIDNSVEPNTIQQLANNVLPSANVDSSNEQYEESYGEPVGDIVIGISDKIYFYNESNFSSKTSSYFIKGQKAEFYEISDDNTEDDFLYVNFEYKGKVKTGYVLRSDVEFE